MSYSINKHYVRSDGSLAWRLVWEDYTSGVRKVRYVTKKELPNLGLLPTMSIDEAREQVRRLNADGWLKRREKIRNNIAVRLTTEDKVKSAFLPEVMVTAFEDEVLLRRFSRGDREKLNESGMISHWRAVKRMIRAIKLDPSEWFKSPQIIYGYFESIKASPSYAQKLLRIANHWGHFISYKTGKPFLEVPPATGYDKERIADKYFDSKNTKESLPISPSDLAKAKDKLEVGHYNWLFVAMWFGLRPGEVDSLLDRTRWKISVSGDYRVLNVYQSKLKSLARDKRWKMIPILFPEQEEALKIIESMNMVRPLPKTVRNNVKDGVNCYGPRKGFVDLMLDKGYSLESISAWMGHTSIDRTWRSYKDRLALVVVKKAS